MGWLRDTFLRRGGPGSPAEGGHTLQHLAQGAAQLEARQFEAAAESLERALALAKPADTGELPRLHYLLGRAYVGLGRLAPASMSFEAAVRAKPDFVEAIEEGARVLRELDSHDEAAEWLQRLAKLRPTASTRLQLARELRQSGRNEEAADLLLQFCAKNPRNIDAALLYHHVLVSLGRLEEALAQVDRVLKMRKPDAALLVNRSVPLARMGRHDEALACLTKALKLEPSHPRALDNRVAVLMSQLRVNEAIAAAQDALRLHPADADLHWRLGAALLLVGDWQQGWAEAEWRTRAQGYDSAVPRLDQPRWQGESLAGRTILLYAEQGFGDSIQFLRFVPELARTARSVLVLASPELRPLVAAALPANCRVLEVGAPLPAFDFHCPLMSVPAVLGTTVDTLPARVPYLRAAPEAVDRWRKRLGSGSLNIGLCWSGNPRHYRDRERSMDLAQMQGLAVDGCRYFVLQPQKRPGDEQALAAWKGLVDTGADLVDFAATAAAIEALDLVITVDTSVAHVAGALGKPVWILLARVPEWRWMLDRADSPWYPTARLYRQAKRGDWAPVIESVRADLAQLARQRDV